jgi:hypothetical protein
MIEYGMIPAEAKSRWRNEEQLYPIREEVFKRKAILSNPNIYSAGLEKGSKRCCCGFPC